MITSNTYFLHYTFLYSKHFSAKSQVQQFQEQNNRCTFIYLITIPCYYLYSTEFKVPEEFPSFAIVTEELNDNL